jgi:hypothetical protein
MYLWLSAWKSLKNEGHFVLYEVHYWKHLLVLFVLFLIYERCWIRNQIAAIVAGRPNNFAYLLSNTPVASCHPSPLLSHPFLLHTYTCPFPMVLSWPFISLSNPFLYLATYFHIVATFTTCHLPLLLSNYIPYLAPNAFIFLATRLSAI